MLQRILFLLFGASFVGLACVLVFLNPFQSGLYIILFLLGSVLFLFSAANLLIFWWIYSIKKVILTIVQVNRIVYQGLISSLVAIFYLIMYQTGALNIWSGAIVFIVYFLYELWINSG